MPGQRFSVWTSSGTFAREFRAQAAQGPAWPIAVLSNDNVLVSIENHYDPRGGAGLVRDQMLLSLITPTGEAAGEIGRFPGAEWLLYKDANSFRASRFPFGRSGFVDASGGNLLHASSDSAVLTVYDLAGRFVRSIPIATTRRALGRREIDAVLADLPDEGARQAVRRQLRSAGGRVRAPAVTDLRVDGGGNAWVQTPGSAPRVSRWSILSIDGREIGTVLMPDSYFPLDIQDSRVLLRETDSDGVQRVSLRSVIR
jgi:hypothetical protein